MDGSISTSDLQRPEAADVIPPPILIVAAPGAPGPSLAAALGRNPWAYYIPETNLSLSIDVETLLRDMTGLRAVQIHGLLRALSHLLGGEQSIAGIDMARRWLSLRMHLPTGRLAHEIAARIAPRRMITPVASALFDPDAAERLALAFPGASLVHLRMHPRSHGEATVEAKGLLHLLGAKDESVVPTLPDPQQLWRMAEEGAARLKELMAGQSILSVRAEDLVRDPQSTLAGLADALGLPKDGPALDAMMRPEASPFVGPGPFGAHATARILSFETLRGLIPEAPSLSGSLPWRDDGAGLSPEVRQLAAEAGYV